MGKADADLELAALPHGFEFNDDEVSTTGDIAVAGNAAPSTGGYEPGDAPPPAYTVRAAFGLRSRTDAATDAELLAAIKSELDKSPIDEVLVLRSHCDPIGEDAPGDAPPPALPEFDDPKVQIVYGLLCSNEMCPPAGEHWEGFVARHIVRALAVAPPPDRTVKDSLSVGKDSLLTEPESLPQAAETALLIDDTGIEKKAISPPPEPCATCGGTGMVPSW